MFETPVVFTIFNRPAPTARVLGALRIVQPANLFVIADGPRATHPDDPERCAATRALIDQVNWDCRLTRLFHHKNLGVGPCLAQGIRWVFEQVDAAIFIEDDTLPDPTFFSFCAAMLDRYRDDERVAMVQGTNALGAWRADRSDYFFSRYGPLWGWACWKRTWREYDYEFSFMDAPDFRTRLFEQLGDPVFAAFLIDLCERSRAAAIESWDTQITVQQILRGALCIVPAVNPIQNLGFGPDGSHTRQRFALGANLERGAIPSSVTPPPAVAADDEYDRQLVALLTGNPSFELLRGRVEQQFAAERYAPALLWLTRAMQQGVAASNAEQAALHVLYARALHALGQRERAQTALDRALAAVPNMDQALTWRQTWAT